MIIRLTICLLFTCYMSYGNIIPSDDDASGLVYTCPNIPGGVIMDSCLPPKPKIVTNDNVSNNDEDRLWFNTEFAAFGGEITASCNTVVIKVLDLTQAPIPVAGDCTSQRITTRRIEIYDGDPNDPSITARVCEVNYVSDIPFNLTIGKSNPDPYVISCTDDIVAEINRFVDANGFGFDPPYDDRNMLGCAPPVVSSIVSPTNLLADPKSTISYDIMTLSNPNPCGNIIESGNGSVRVQFRLTDACGYEADIITDFVVQDLEDPSIVCPQDLTVDIADNDIETKVLALEATATDNCTDDPIIQSSFTELTDDQKNSCDAVQIIPITYVTNDNCGNTDDCQITLTIINSGEIEITCPADTLLLECGLLTNLDRFGDWIATARAIDFRGDVISGTSISNNFDTNRLDQTLCETIDVITFTATDICNRTENCTGYIKIVDTTLPTVDVCPPDLVVSTTNPNMRQEVLDWAAAFSATDQCNPNINLTDNLDRSILDGNCAASALEIRFLADDNCNNIDSMACMSSLTIQNDIVSDFTALPANETFICSTNPDPNLLRDWIATAAAANNLAVPQTFTVQADININSPVFSSCDTTANVTFFFVDQCGIRIEHVATISVIDNVPPEITCPGDVTFNGLFSEIEPDIQAWLQSPITNNLISDNCGFGPGSVVPNYFPQLFANCNDSITEPITFAVRDACGNFGAPCMSDLTVITDKEPTLQCPNNLVLECGDVINEDLINLWIEEDFVGTDFLGDTIAVSNNYNASGLMMITCLDSLEVVFSIQDNCNYTDECIRVIIIQDTTPPNLTCPPTIALNSTSTDNAQVIDDWILSAQFDDNGCFMPAITNDYIPTALDFCNPNNQFIDITFNVEDGCGLNAQPCVGRINFNLDPPQINCPNTTLNLECGAPGNMTEINAWLESASSNDNNTLDLQVINDFSEDVIDSLCTQSISVAFESIDVCDKMSTCTGIININDTEPPVFASGDCPTPLSLSSGTAIDIKENIFNDWIAGIAVLDCNIYTLSHNFNTSNFTVDCDDRTIPITFNLTDECLNAATPCMSELVITNSINPVISCPTSALTVECGADNNEQIIRDWLATATADDGMTSTAVADNFTFANPDLLSCASTIDVEFLMSNFCGVDQTCDQQIIVEDTTDPEFTTCPANETFLLEDPNFDALVSDWIATAEATDNCVSALSYSDDTDDVLPIASLPSCMPFLDFNITFTVMDDCGQSVDCIAIMTITSERSPTITCPLALEIECGDSDNADMIDDWLDSATAVDEDGNMLFPSNGYNPAELAMTMCDGVITVLFNAVDNCNNNLECNGEIIVSDTTIPTAICPSDITVNSTDPGAGTAAADWLESNGAVDNCSMATASSMAGFAFQSDLCTAAEINAIEFYATDFCGMRDTCVATLTINKDEPTISCPDNLDLQCGETTNDAIITDWLGEFSGADNNGEPLQVDNDFSMATLPNDCETTPISFNFSVTDDCNVKTACVGTITQRDTLAPLIINCPSDANFDFETPNLVLEIENWLNSFETFDMCNTATNDRDYNLDLSAIDCDTMQVVIFTTVDECGNTDNSSCTAAISLTNNEFPEISCPDPIEVKCNDGATIPTIQGFLVDYTILSAEEDVSGVENDLDFDLIDIECSGTYTEVVTITVIDHCGKTADCMTEINFIPAAALYVPTIFNPGGNGIGGEDSRFSIRSNIAITTIKSFRIYSRWGDLMFERENFDPNAEPGWDGRDNLGRITQGVYTYRIDYEDTFANPFEEVGTLTLIK